MRTDVLGVGFDDLTLEEAAAAGAALVEAGGFHYAVTPNPEFLLAAKHNPAFRQALRGADLVLADGVGVVYSAKILGRPLKGKVPASTLPSGCWRGWPVTASGSSCWGPSPAWRSWPPPT